jgi:lipopolysaccharide transport protein LptA
MKLRKNFQAVPVSAVLLVLVAAIASTTSSSQEANLRLPIMLDADSTDYDRKNSMVMFTGLRLSQGDLGIQAERGQASKPDFEDSVWQFGGNVVIDVEGGHMESDTADLQFRGHQLQLATIAGSPAIFRMQRPGSEIVTYAEAGSVRYDFEAGVVEFSDNAMIVEGCNQISSNYLVYNIKEQRINAQTAGDSDEKVKITYTPRDSDDAATCDPQAGRDTGIVDPDQSE